ncbi:MAG: hypothetical protein IJD87_04665 [Turicibacter sp.]|nr:hypothetical protein [Turicibacter sp.]
MLFNNILSAEDALVDEDSPSQTSQLDDQLYQQRQQTTNLDGSRYSGSTFAGLLVIILFVVFALHKMGCLKHH